MGRMHSDAQLTLFSSCSLGKINKFLLRSLVRQLTLFSSFSLGKISLLILRSLVRQFAGSSSVKFLFLLCARQNKQVSFALAYVSVPAHTKDNGS